MKTKLFIQAILFSFLFIAQLVLSGCTQENLHQEIIDTEKEIFISSLVYDADTRKFFKNRDREEYYTGIAIERNDTGALTRQYEYDDGEMVAAKIWTDFGGHLEQTIDMRYKNHRAYEGWYNILLILPNNGKMTNIYSVFKNGEKVYGWDLHNDQLKMMYTPFNGERRVLLEASNLEDFYDSLPEKLKEHKLEHFHMLADGKIISSER